MHYKKRKIALQVLHLLFFTKQSANIISYNIKCKGQVVKTSQKIRDKSPCLHILSRLLHCDSPPGCFLRQRTHATSSSDGAVKSGSYGRAITVDNLAFYRVNLQILGHGWVETHIN